VQTPALDHPRARHSCRGHRRRARARQLRRPEPPGIEGGTSRLLRRLRGAAGGRVVRRPRRGGEGCGPGLLLRTCCDARGHGEDRRETRRALPDPGVSEGFNPRRSPSPFVTAWSQPTLSNATIRQNSVRRTLALGFGESHGARMFDWNYWYEIFNTRAAQLTIRRPERDDWLSDEEFQRIADSLATFQLGEQSEGRTLLRFSEDFALRRNIAALPAVTALFIKEEQHHALQ